MGHGSRRIFYFFFGFLVVSFLSFASPDWLQIAGVGPSWEVLWLLPLSLEEGPIVGVFAGLCLGLLLDGISLLGVSQIPPLLVIGFWWGRLGIKGQSINNSFNLGFLAWIGTVVIGINFWIQQLFLLKGIELNLFNNWVFHALLAKSIITALIAPLACSLILLIFFKRKSKDY